jgi:hypothetical protein
VYPERSTPGQAARFLLEFTFRESGGCELAGWGMKPKA